MDCIFYFSIQRIKFASKKHQFLFKYNSSRETVPRKMGFVTVVTLIVEERRGLIPPRPLATSASCLWCPPSVRSPSTLAARQTGPWAKPMLPHGSVPRTKWGGIDPWGRARQPWPWGAPTTWDRRWLYSDFVRNLGFAGFWTFYRVCVFKEGGHFHNPKCKLVQGIFIQPQFVWEKFPGFYQSKIFQGLFVWCEYVSNPGNEISYILKKSCSFVLRAQLGNCHIGVLRWIVCVIKRTQGTVLIAKINTNGPLKHYVRRGGSPESMTSIFVRQSIPLCIANKILREFRVQSFDMVKKGVSSAPHVLSCIVKNPHTYIYSI